MAKGVSGTRKLCFVDACNKMSHSGGRCAAHHARWKRYGRDDEPYRRTPSYDGELCPIAGCDKPKRKNGLCTTHDAQRLRTDEWRQKRRESDIRRQEKALGRSKPDFCESCGEAPRGEYTICFDHDHKTEVPRGWLCSPCNLALGLLLDSPTKLDLLAAYIRSKQKWG